MISSVFTFGWKSSSQSSQGVSFTSASAYRKPTSGFSGYSFHSTRMAPE